MASLSAWCTDYTCHHSHRLNEPPAKGGVWNGLPRLAHSHAQSSATTTSGLQLGRAEVLWGLRNFLNTEKPEHHSINRRKEERRKEASDIPPSMVENDLCSTRQILALFRGQSWGDCWGTGRSAYGPFRALRCHLELKLKLKLLVTPWPMPSKVQYVWIKCAPFSAFCVCYT